MTLPIVTERLVIRRFTYDDVRDLLGFASQPSVAKVTSSRIQATEGGVRKYIDLQNSYQPFERDKVFELAIERQEDGKVIGLLGLICQDDGQGELGWALGVEYRGQGYATEAARALMDYGFNSLGLHRIHADTSTDNLASLRMMERLGMRREGLLRGAVYEEGKWADRYVYGMLADEWSDAGASVGESMFTAGLSGKIALVTGSSRGIGRAIALALANAGADVAVHCRTSRGEAEEVASSIRRVGRRALILQGDVRQRDDVRAVVHSVLTEFGRVDVLVNNAGYASGGSFLDLSEEAWLDQIDTLAGGYYRFTQATLPSMMAQQAGVILNIASTCGVQGSPGEVAYAAANGAIIALTRSLAAEVGSKGIRVNGLLVAWASNAFDPNEPSHSAYLPRFPLGRVTDVSEIAQAALYLCSSAASGITGATLPVDAGYLCC